MFRLELYIPVMTHPIRLLYLSYIKSDWTRHHRSIVKTTTIINYQSTNNYFSENFLFLMNFSSLIS